MLEITDIVTSYGKIEALKGVSLSVAPGKITCLLGPNGAGKTTTMMTVSGLLKPRRGNITFEERNITGRDPGHIVQSGIALVPENRLVFPDMTVHDNLRTGAYSRSDNEIEDDIEHMFERFPRLHERQLQHAGTLSGGEQQMLAVGRALMTNPSCLIMDEPSEGLAPMIIQDIGNAIQSLKAEGLAVVLVEQNAAFAVKTVDRVCVITNGKVVHESSPQELWADEEIRRNHLGIG